MKPPRISRAALLALCSAMFSVGSVPLAHGANELFYIGTYTGEGSNGIYSSTLEPGTGALGEPVLAATTKNPASLAISADGKFVYAANETESFRHQPTGSVTAMKVTGDGAHLEILNDASSGGKGPCHLSISQSGEAIFVANYTGGSIAVVPLKSDGSLSSEPSSIVQHTGSSINRERQDRPHAHEIISDPQGDYIYTSDLGLDRVKAYTFDRAKATFTPAPERDVIVKPGTGPRHIVFNQSGDRLYVLGEMGSDLTVYKLDRASGHSEVLQNLSTLPSDWKGRNLAAEIQIDRAGKYIYASNRGNDTLVVFAVGTDGQVTFVQRLGSGGKAPRSFALDPSGHFLVAADQDSNAVVIFRVDGETGKLEQLSSKISVSKPVWISFLPETR